MKRINRILKYMIQSQKFVKIEEIASCFQISIRTAREDVATVEEYLEQNYIPFIRDRKNGYYIDSSGLTKQEIIQLIRNIDIDNNYYTEEERFKIILQTLLLLDTSVTYDTLCRKVFVSKTTIIKEFENVLNWCMHNHIEVERKQRVGITINSTELAWRKAVLDYLVSNMKDIDLLGWMDSKFSVLLVFDDIVDEFIRTLIKGVNPAVVSEFINKYEKDFNVKFSSNYYIVLLLYICISLNRIGENKQIYREDIKTSYSITSVCRIWMEKNKYLITSGLKTEISETELDLIMLYLSGAQKIYEENKETDRIESIYNNQIVSKFIHNVETILDIDFSCNSDLHQNLMMHIEAAVHRIRFGIKCNNALKEEIRDLYPEVHEACRKAISFLETDLNESINEDEISFLTVYICAAMENNRNTSEYKVIVVCADGVGASYMLCSRLLNEFTNIYVQQVAAVDQLMAIDMQDTDMIITTVPLFLDVGIKVIKVSPLLPEKDIIQIKKAMSFCRITNRKEKMNHLIVDDLMKIVLQEIPEVNYKKMKRHFDDYFNQNGELNLHNMGIMEYLRPELIALNVEVSDWREAIAYGGNLLYQQNYIEHGYIAKMISIFEEMGNYISIYDGVVMPHGKPSDGVIKTGFSFVTLKNPILFGERENGEYVKMVITLAADESMTHLKTIKDLSHILDEEFMRSIDKIKSKEQFIDCVQKKMKS